MAKINSIIPSQNFELVRDRIAQILAVEITHQADLTNDSNLDLKVYMERNTPIDKSELHAVNVCLSRGDYSNKDMTGVDGSYTYNIDCYTSAKTIDDPDNPGKKIRADQLSATALHRLLGICRAILENPVYKTLGFTPPFTCTVGISTIAIADPGNTQDAITTMMGRLEFKVRVPETCALIDAPLIGEFSTTVKLYTTDKGYHWGRQITLLVVDSNLLPIGYIPVLSLKIDGTEYEINQEFSDRAEVIAYLNADFHTDLNLTGTFSISGKRIIYDNKEGFTKIEIMAIYQPYMRVFAMGSAPSLNVTTIPVANGSSITDDTLGETVLEVRIGNISAEPLTAGGWSHNVGTKTLSLGSNYEDINVYVLTKQVPA